MKHIDLKNLVSDFVSGRNTNEVCLLFFIVILIPILCIGYGGFNLYEYWDLQENGQLTNGEIVRIEEERSYTSSEPNFFPVVAFQDQNGVVHKYRAGRAKKGQYKSGQQVKVVYDLNKPKRVVLLGLIERSMRAFLILLGLGAIGLIFIMNVFRQVSISHGNL